MAELYQIFVHVICGRGSVLVDGVIILYVLPVSWMTSCLCPRCIVCIPKRRAHDCIIDSNEILLDDKDWLGLYRPVHRGRVEQRRGEGLKSDMYD